ncbi:MAG: hypothetical protein HZB38_14265 [Planctomycetes bacterium]|nr:hypothetical protein [Planctomycetota bacterium]
MCRTTGPRAAIAILSSWVVLAALLTGCAPREFDRAIAYYADQDHVRDASSRRTSVAWFLRFDAAAIYDLDAAAAELDVNRARRMADEALANAGRLAVQSIGGEIARLSPGALDELSRRAGCAASAAALSDVLRARAETALNAELAAQHAMPANAWRQRVQEIRAGIEPLPDDRDRTTRKVILAALAPAVVKGISDTENRIVKTMHEKAAQRLPGIAIWNPADNSETALARWAPRMAVEWPQSRDYPESYDRIGAVSLAGTRDEIRVSVDSTRPTLYCYPSTAVIHGQRFDQFNYVWWFSDRPAMTTDDAAAGHIDGGTLRLTLDSSGRPAIAEIILNCGCGHEVYVADDVERAARDEFGPPIDGGQYCCAGKRSEKRPILVAGVFQRTTDAPARPTVVLAAGTHEPLRFLLSSDMAAIAEKITDETALSLADYDVLDRLPLGDGVASMFGADGLVHFAGRREGYLLAPSGMLSAGQPRKRGTQRIRWDDYLFDDPKLLESTLRLPTACWRKP